MFILGRNALENSDIIKHAAPTDWWVHLKDESSPHCVIEKNEIRINDIRKACEMIIKRKKTKNKSFIYTQINNLKLTKKRGEVLIRDTNKVFEYKIVL